MKFLRISIILLITVLLGSFYYFTSNNDPQIVLLDMLNSQDTTLLWVILIISGLTIISSLSGLPVFYFSIALGFLMNFLPALAISWLMNLISIMFTFFMVKVVFSRYFKEKYGKRKIIRKINIRIHKYGLWTIAISRSIYVIPTNIINFSFPLSSISIKQYLSGTMIGLIPECLINVTIGHLLKRQVLLLSSPQQNTLKIIIIGVTLVLIIIGLLIVNYRRKRVDKASINKIVPRLKEN